MMKEAALHFLLRELLAEGWASSRTTVPEDAVGRRQLLRTLMNVRPPLPANPQLLEVQDRLLSAERDERGVLDPRALPSVAQVFQPVGDSYASRLVLWRGDITTLAADAIVNAANAKLLGCFIPHHRCIDNAIHSAAGIQLRLECRRLIDEQGRDEPVGRGKITPGYNLPSRYVIHTVGPMIEDQVRTEDVRLLESCYESCLDSAAQQEGVRVLAFCCISTGEFRFPKVRAAEIAVRTVRRWLTAGRGELERVIFNVFTQQDHDVYAELLGKH
jgi:O-acetyl-ADP-ribose deacetylase (regulator of RNase III)